MSGNNALLPYVRVKVFLSPFRGYLKATSFGRGCLLILFLCLNQVPAPKLIAKSKLQQKLSVLYRFGQLHLFRTGFFEF